MLNENNLTWHEHRLSKDEREEVKNQKACLIWFTGLSGSGKSTIANMVEAKLYLMKKHTYLLDGDNIRLGLNKDLGFTGISSPYEKPTNPEIYICTEHMSAESSSDKVIEYLQKKGT